MTQSTTGSESTLSKRAVRFLATLHRYPSVPISELQTALSDQGLPVCESWLAFHERYAGYESNLGRVGMVWGLLHKQYRYVKSTAATPTVEAEKDGETGQWLVRCADMSPHYTIELNEQGHLEFDFTHYSSFDFFVERSAHYVEFTDRGQVTDYIDTSNSEALEMINKAEHNDELSDQFLELYEADTVIGTRVPGSDDWESILAVTPGVAGPTQQVYKPYKPPAANCPTLKSQLARVLGRKQPN